jgi:hypothetical protein
MMRNLRLARGILLLLLRRMVQVTDLANSNNAQ